MRRYDTILFDMDDTLFDFHRSEREALQKTLLRRGLEPTAQRLDRYREISEALWRGFERGEVTAEWLVVERFAQFARELGCDADPAAWNREHAEGIGRESWLMPGAEKLCRSLFAAGCRLAIVTNGMGISQRGRLASSPIAPLISGLFVSHDLGVRKPETAYFQAVLHGLGNPDRSRTVIVGDGLPSDIQGGLNAGIDSIWFNPRGEENTTGIHPSEQARSLEEVGRIILYQTEPYPF